MKQINNKYKLKNELNNLQKQIDETIESEITFKEIMDEIPKYNMTNDNPNLILGYDPTVSYMVYRYNNFLREKKKKKECGDHCQSHDECHRAKNKQCRQCHHGKCNPRHPKCKCHHGTPDKKHCKINGEIKCSHCDKGYRLKHKRCVKI